MNTTLRNYFSLTAVLAAMGCGPSAQQNMVKVSVTPIPEQSPEPDCSSLDLTTKAGFSTSFMVSDNIFCYGIASNGEHYSDKIHKCDDEGRPLPGYAVIMREFAGPNAGLMQLNAIVDVSEDTTEYVPFWREPTGEITTIPYAVIPDNINRLFDTGKNMLDEIRTIPEICKELLEYKSQ